VGRREGPVRATWQSGSWMTWQHAMPRTFDNVCLSLLPVLPEMLTAAQAVPDAGEWGVGAGGGDGGRAMIPATRAAERPVR